MFSPGSLVHARGREWLVLPESETDLLIVRPLGGLDEEQTALLPGLEPIVSATFALPAAADLGDFRSGRLLRDAARLSTRAAAGPFRSFGRIAVEPRAFQLVPLMMALRLDPVRLLIADDVGIGKTIEAALIARELLDRGEIRRLAVLCPPQLAEQWQRELREKFHIEAELVLADTVQRLERDLALGESLFDRHPVTVVSTDFVKSVRRADDFVRACPEFVIVDEAHGCTPAGGAGRVRQQRYDLVRRIAADPARHLLLVTATPHSGDEAAFRALLGLLDPEFDEGAQPLDAAQRDRVRRRLARHLIQRRRSDVSRYAAMTTAFPSRTDRELTYRMAPAYRQLFDDIVDFAHEYALQPDQSRQRRVRWWSALALLRCVSSSPAAAAATLRNRAAVDTAEQADALLVEQIGIQTVLDQDDGDDAVVVDFSPGADHEEAPAAVRRRLQEFARRAEALTPADDRKLQAAIVTVRELLAADLRPVVFCRFIETAEYVAAQLRAALGAAAEVAAVTGTLPAAERELRVQELGTAQRAVLVATDCLSEGINLQHHFSAVLHYDLAWNPTRHEQREGRVDRFGQRRPQVQVVSLYGSDNAIDGVILEVLLRKHKAIKSDLGVTVAVPASSSAIAEALVEAALFRRRGNAEQLTLDLPNTGDEAAQALTRAWDAAAVREKAARSRYAQAALDPAEVLAEWQRVQAAIGGGADVARFVQELSRTLQIPVSERAGRISVQLGPLVPRSLRQALDRETPFHGRTELPLADDEIYLGRTAPLIEALAGWLLDQALDPLGREVVCAARCGVLATAAVPQRTLLLLCRFRYQLHAGRSERDVQLLEEIVPLALHGPVDQPQWLSEAEAEALLAAEPARRLPTVQIEQRVDLLLAQLPTLQRALAAQAAARAVEHLTAHRRVRAAVHLGAAATVRPLEPVDLLAAFELLPAG